MLSDGHGSYEIINISVLYCIDNSKIKIMGYEIKLGISSGETIISIRNELPRLNLSWAQLDKER